MGGITGQLVPEVRLLYTESQVGDLLDELDVLRDLIGRTNDDARSASNEISERMQAISDRAGEVQGAISDLADLTTDWANENIDAVNSMSARISWLTDKLSPIMEDATDALDLMEKLAGQMNDVMDEAQEAGDLALGQRTGLRTLWTSEGRCPAWPGLGRPPQSGYGAPAECTGESGYGHNPGGNTGGSF